MAFLQRLKTVWLVLNMGCTVSSSPKVTENAKTEPLEQPWNSKWSLTKVMQTYYGKIQSAIGARKLKHLQLEQFLQSLPKQSPESQTVRVLVMNGLLGSSAGIDVKVPIDPPVFPESYHVQSETGMDCYWMASQLEVTNQVTDQQGSMVIMWGFIRTRLVNLETQRLANWSDEDCQVCFTTASMLISFPGQNKLISRSPNVIWPMVGGKLSYSQAGSSFAFQVGPDSISGSTECLPLTVTINDRDNMFILLKVGEKSNPSGNSIVFDFKSGCSCLNERNGTEFCWPQVYVTGMVSVSGTTFKINAGSGFLSHSTWTPKPPIVSSAPLRLQNNDIADPTRIKQKLQYFDGTIFLGEASQPAGKENHILNGAAVEPNASSNDWIPELIRNGSMFPVSTMDTNIPDFDDSKSSRVNVPYAWNYSLDPSHKGLIELMYEEYIDKIENLFNFGLKIEVPVVSFFRNDKGELEQDGVGFMEILDFEPTKDFVQRSLSFIKT